MDHIKYCIMIVVAFLMKTIFCDIDGTLLQHTGDIQQNLGTPIVLPFVLDRIREWDRNNFHLVLTTGRKESSRERTMQQLSESGITYDELVMGLPNGDRILINDHKTNNGRNTAYAINLVRNQGLEHVNLLSDWADRFPLGKIEKPWGYEEWVEVNDKYVVKKLFMRKGHSCSLQYHELKTETITVLEGELSVLLGKEETIMRPFETITIRPYTVHRMSAKSGDCLYMESSTNELWDVVRLQDDYNRNANDKL